MPKSIDQLRRDAKALRRAYEVRDRNAAERIARHGPASAGGTLKHADFLHVIARENDFESWPRLAWAAETVGLSRAARQQRLKIALFHGQMAVIDRLLADDPDLADGIFGLQCALYDQTGVAAALAVDPALATRLSGPRCPILHLAFSKYIHLRPELEGDMIAVAEMLLAHGADVNDAMPSGDGDEHTLSALYGALGHANNMRLARWLLEHGANPNDGESLYHATELGHHDGLRMLLDHGADPKGTNALLRAMDFHDVEAVRLLLAHGASAVEYDHRTVGAEVPWVIPALHQAARRMSPPEMIDLLLEAGADPRTPFQGLTPYAAARIHGNAALSTALAARGHETALSPIEAVLAQLADDTADPGVHVDPARLPEGCRGMLRDILHLPGKLDHMKRLVAAGMEYDRPDAAGITPVQAAGWEGLPDVMGYFMSLRPDLSHVNAYGGTLLSTIIHGSENAPDRAARDHLGCLRLVLEHGVALPRKAIEFAGQPEVSAFLADWAEAHPGQVVEGGVA